LQARIIISNAISTDKWNSWKLWTKLVGKNNIRMTMHLFYSIKWNKRNNMDPTKIILKI
jgi:hypothetical protein